MPASIVVDLDCGRAPDLNHLVDVDERRVRIHIDRGVMLVAHHPDTLRLLAAEATNAAAELEAVQEQGDGIEVVAPGIAVARRPPVDAGAARVVAAS